MYQFRQTKQFKKDIKKIRKQGKNLDDLKTLTGLLLEGKELPEGYLDQNRLSFGTFGIE